MPTVDVERGVTTVTLTLSEKEAKVLKAVTGNINTEALDLLIRNSRGGEDETILRTGRGDSDAIYYALDGADV